MGMVTGQREIRPVWNNAQRVNHQNKFTYPHPKRNFVPTAAATKSGQVPINAAKQSSSRAATSISTVRPVNTVVPKPKVNDALPTTYSYFKAHSPVRRTFNQKSAAKTNNFNEQVNTAKVNNVTTAGPKAVVSAAEGKRENAGNPQYALKDQRIFDSGCYRHMTGNKSYLTDYQDIDGGFVAFTGSPKGGKITGKGKIRTGKLNFEDVYFVKELNPIPNVPSMQSLEATSIFDDAYDDRDDEGVEVNLNNLETTMRVPVPSTTRSQPPGFEDLQFPDKVYKVEKTLYGLHQAPRAWFQVTPKVSHLHAVKRIFRYLKGQPKLGLWYPRDSPFDLEAFSDSDYAVLALNKKPQTEVGERLSRRSWGDIMERAAITAIYLRTEQEQCNINYGNPNPWQQLMS
ncbi:ribonuclease H-like domain-containing protein [Tanacetum coccineum]